MSFICEDTDKVGWCIYWIHKESHTDMKTEGYIGLSENHNKRFLSHERWVRVLSMELDEDIYLTPVFWCESKREALYKESELRPEAYIGWNISPGGSKVGKDRLSSPPVHWGHRFERNLLKGDQRTPAQKAASKAHSERMKGRTPWNKKVES